MKLYYSAIESFKMIRSLCQTFKQHPVKYCYSITNFTVKQQHGYHLTAIQHTKKDKIDFSRVPVLDVHDIDERMVRGSGPGGQAVNKTSNCIVLKHKPTGFVVKCHTHRSATANRNEAKRLMIERLDEHFNGEFSVANQIKQIEKKKSATNTHKRKKLEEMKRKFKERENID